MADEEIGGGRATPLQRRRVRSTGWTRKRRATFLDHLAATCNVTTSCAAVGMNPCSVYALRRRDPVFAGLWQEALDAGYARLETALVGRALGDINAIEPGESGDAAVAASEAPIDVTLALTLLGRRGKAAAASPRPSARDARRRFATEEETNAALLRKLAVLRRQLEKQREGER